MRSSSVDTKCMYCAATLCPGRSVPTQSCYETGGGVARMWAEQVERESLPQCCYVTAASPGIAGAYASKYGIPTPTSILNVFPLAERPLRFRETRPDGPLRLYWFSQTIGPGRGLENVIRAMER